MRVFILVLLVGFSLSDEAASTSSSCSRKCSDHYPNDAQNVACQKGCELRSQSLNPFAFLGCFAGCDQEFKNSTDQREACRYACQLPRRSSVVMTMVGDDDGGKKWKVVEQTDDDEPVVRYSNDDPLSAILFRGQPSLTSNSDESEEETDDDDALFNHMQQMQSRMEELMKSISRQFNEQLMKSSASEEHLALERPSGHDPWIGAGETVGNTADDGQPIIITGNDGNERKSIMVELRRSSQPHFASILHWTLVAVGIAALLTAICAVAAFIRSLRNGAYRRVEGTRSQIPVFMHVQAGALPEKKVPLEGWIEEPSGVPPPAYDQVSIHKNQEIEEKESSPK